MLKPGTTGMKERVHTMGCGIEFIEKAFGFLTPETKWSTK
jgi:hypothetical protein